MPSQNPGFEHYTLFSSWSFVLQATQRNRTTETALAAEHVAINWCVEHGVPEDICALCNAKVAAEYKKKGDWCKEHNRPESQCFLCNPKLEAKFAAEYEAKYGKKPPKP